MNTTQRHHTYRVAFAGCLLALASGLVVQGAGAAVAPTTTTTAAPTTTTSTAPATTTTIVTTTTTAAVTTTTMPPAVGVSPSTMTVGATMTVNSTGWMPGTNVVVTMHSTPVTMGTLVSDNSGGVSGSFTVPAGTALGSHVIQLDGTGLNGLAMTLTANVTVVAATTTTVVTTLPTTGTETTHLAELAFVLLTSGTAVLVLRRRLAS